MEWALKWNGLKAMLHKFYILDSLLRPHCAALCWIVTELPQMRETDPGLDDERARLAEEMKKVRPGGARYRGCFFFRGPTWAQLQDCRCQWSQGHRSSTQSSTTL